MSSADENEFGDLDDADVIDLEVLQPAKRLLTTDKPSPSNSATSNGRKKVLPQLMLDSGTSSNVLLSGIFGVDQISYDISLYSTRLVMTIINGKIKPSTGKRMSVKRVKGDCVEIYLKDFFGVKLRRAKSKSVKAGPCQGIELHTYAEKDANRLKHEIIFLAHPSEEICTNWLQQINTVLQTITGRPKLAKLYLDTSDNIKLEFQSKILPIFVAADLNTVDIEHKAKIPKDVEQRDLAKIVKDIECTDFSKFHCVLVVGGDSLVNTVVDGLLKKIQFDNGIVLGGRESLLSSMIPIGVIPIGISNVTAHTVHGTSDMVTAALNIVYGRILMSDILSVSHSQGSFFKFAFSAQYGFGCTVMKMVNKSKIAGNNKYQLAIAKGLTKSKFRAYGCEVKYKSAHPSFGEPLDGNVCRSGCSVCSNDSTTPCPDGSNYSDLLQDFNPLETSNTSSQLSEMAASDCNATKGEYLGVSLYSTASHCDMAPLGLSKYTHIADGCMDLILVHSTERKEFMRFLKRNGNSKNQLDFPFVESYRVKEVSFHVRMPVGWSYRDKDYSEIIDQARQKKSRIPSSVADESIKVVADGDLTVISDLRLDDSFSSDEEDEEDSGSASSKANNVSNTGLSAHQSNSLFSSKNASPVPTKVAEGQVHEIHKYTDYDRRLKKRKKKDLEKEMKAKDKEERAIKSVWYLDTVPCTETDLTIRVHQKLVTFYGSGMSREVTEPDVFCFPAV